MRWNKHQLGPIGIDLGAHTLRAMQLAVTGTRVEVAAAAQAPAYPGPVDPTEAISANAAAIKELLAQGKFRGKRIVTALPLSVARLKNLRLPCMPENELDDAVRFEAMERFQSLGPEPQVRYYCAGKVSAAQGDQFELIVIGVAGDVIRDFLGAIAQLGLLCEGLDVSPGASFRPFERFLKRHDDVEQVRAILDIGHLGSRLIIARGVEIAFIKLFDVGAARLHAAVAERLSIDADEAAELLAAADDAGDEGAEKRQTLAVTEAAAPEIERLGKEVGLCLRYFAVTFRGIPATEVICVGEAARNTMLRKRLSAVIGTPAHMGHPLRGVATEAVFSGGDRRIGQPEWATALGLALKRLGDHAARPASQEDVVVA